LKLLIDSLLSGGADGSIHIHDVFNLTGNFQFTCKNVGKIDRQSNHHCHKYSVECVQWYPLDTGMFLSSGMDKNLKIWDANAQVPADVVLVNGKIYHHHMSPNATQHNLVAGYKFDPINANNAKILHIQLILPPLR
jgi:DNA excision repair protein ERCC-8